MSETRAWFLARRLAWRLAAVLLVSVLIAAAAVAWRSVATIRSLDDAALQSQARLVGEQLHADANGQPELARVAGFVAAFNASDAENFFIVYDATGHAAIASDPRVSDMVGPFVPAGAGNGLFRVPASERFPQGLLGAVRAVGPWRVVVAQGSEQNEALVESLLREFLVSAVWLVLPICGATVLIGVLTIRHGLRPLHEASRAAGLVGPSRPGVRLPAAGMPGELLALIGAVNQALARLEQALDGQRRFVAAAAHALRTPLAVLTARIDAVADQGQAASLRADADRMARMIGQLLTMARLEELPLEMEPGVLLHRVAVEAISGLAALAIGRGVELVLLEAGVCPPIGGNHAALVLALGNLLDNALAYAPRGSAVEVELVAPALIVVSDRGPGVPEAERAEIFGRFRRGRDAAAGGSGLGLAIVAEIAAAHGGGVSMTARAGGGAAVQLCVGGPVPPDGQFG